jgi:hypothetical protein
MKFSIAPIAAAVSLALGSMAAHAQIGTPGIGANSPSDQTTLFLLAWNSTTGATEIVNLQYEYQTIGGFTPGSSPLNTVSGPAWTTAANPTGAGGTVSQLNFGTILNASAGGFNEYALAVAATTTQTGFSPTFIEGLDVTSSSPTTITEAGVSTVITNVQQEAANWASQNGCPTGCGQFFDSTGGTTIAAIPSPSSSGSWGNGTLSGSAVGSAAQFYQILANVNKLATEDGIAKGADVITPYAGFFFLDSTGHLTYDIPSAVPLPPAVWLFGGGLLGMIGVARRRRAAV